jgi:hypothetical protein
LNKNYDHTITARSRRFRARVRAEQEVARKAARIARRVELDRKRAAAGLPPAKTSTERARECRERQAAIEQAIRTQSWYSPPFRDWHEAKAYLMSVRPDVPEQAIEDTLEVTRRDAHRWELSWNRYLVTKGVEAARTARAVLFQILETKFEGDLTHIEAAMKEAETRTDIKPDGDAHSAERYRDRQMALDMSQIMLREGGILNGEE